MVTRMPKRRRRYSRRHGLVGAAARRRRLFVVVMLAGILVGGFFAIVAVQVSPAERIYERNIDSSFATLVTPIAEESNDTGSELVLMLGGGDSGLTNPALVATLDSMVGDADSAVGDFEALTPPSVLERAASSCLSALQGRARALGKFRSAVTTLLQGPVVDPSGAGQLSGQSAPGTAQAETSIESLSSTLTATDNSWIDCRQDLLEAPGRGANTIPASAWVGGLDVWRQASLSSFITDLFSSAPRVALQPLAIVAVAGNPPAVVTDRGADVLPDTTLYSLHVVVADVGSSEERDVVVTVSMRPFGSLGTAVSETAEATIQAGQSVSFHPPALRVTPGATYGLEVAVSGPGRQNPAPHGYRITIASSSGIPTS
jgi:hypothetical protein